MNWYKISDIVYSEMLPFWRNTLMTKMKNGFYSLIIDIPTEISNKEFISVMIQYFDEVDGGVGCR